MFTCLQTILENIDETRCKQEKLSRRPKANAHDFIMKLPMDDSFIGQRGVKLSGGRNKESALQGFSENPPHSDL